MVFNFFGFARKRRRTHRKHRTTRHRSVRRTAIKSKKPTKTLLNLCKKYGIKVSVKSGGKRRYKKVSVLKKQCEKKMRSLIKNHPDRRKQKTRRSRFGGRLAEIMRRYPKSTTTAKTIGALAAAYALRAAYHEGKGRYYPGEGNTSTPGGARRRAQKDMAIIRAGGEYVRGLPGRFRSSQSKMIPQVVTPFGRNRFGSGGNPPLSASMGYEFCSGGGGVLGANSTGLFPSPCMGKGVTGPTAAFGKRRRSRFGSYCNYK